MLSEEDHKALQQAAVLGCRFDTLLLALATQADLAELIASLKRCRDSGVIIAQDPDGYRWKFTHALVHQFFVDSVSAPCKRRCHEKTVTALEALCDSTSRIDQLAYHALESGQKGKVWRYNERAGDVAFHVCALPEALRYYTVALSAAPDPIAKVRLGKKIDAVKERYRPPT